MTNEKIYCILQIQSSVQVADFTDQIQTSKPFRAATQKGFLLLCAAYSKINKNTFDVASVIKKISGGVWIEKIGVLQGNGQTVT